MKNGEKKLVVESVKEFAKKRGFIQIAPEVRENTNGYPFITFIDKDNKAENVYLSKEASKSVAAGSPAADVLKTHQIGHTTNEAGEPRIKLISNSARLDLASILD